MPSGTSGPFPFEGPATFVTADNPRGQVVPERENAPRRAELAAHLAAAGLTWHPAVGGDPDGDHLEPGAVVLGLDPEGARRLGASFQQAAVYLWAADALHLLSCADDRRYLLGYRATSGSRLPAPC